MKMKILHIVGGNLENGAAKGANILHQALLELNVDSQLLNDSPLKNKNTKMKQKQIPPKTASPTCANCVALRQKTMALMHELAP